CASTLLSILAILLSFSLLFVIPQPLRSTLFPYTTLFRSTCGSCPMPVTRRTSPASCTSSCSRPTGSADPRSSAPVSRPARSTPRSEEHTSELQSRENLVGRLLLEKKKLLTQRL